MSVEIERHFAQLHQNQDHYERFVDLMATITRKSDVWGVAKSVMHGRGLAVHAHDRYLPAARAYLDYVRRHGSLDVRSAEALSVRGRLGAHTRGMYQAQRPVFNLTFDLLLLVASTALGGMPMPAAFALEATPYRQLLQDRCWRAFKHAEQRFLSHSRVQSAAH